MKFKIWIAAAALALGQTAAANVIVNGTFDNNTSGWSGTYSSIVGGSGGFHTINTGSYYYGGNTAVNTINQAYDFSTGELADLAGGGLNFDMSADLFGYASQPDQAIFTVLFHAGTNGGGSILQTISLTGTNAVDWGHQSSFIAGESPNFNSTNGSVSSGAKSASIWLESTRFEGNSNDGYADNLSLAFSSVTSTPTTAFEPATILLLGTALAGIAVGGRRRV